MRLTIYTDYALRMLIYLGVHGDRLCSIGTIASSYGISKNHLMKIVVDLAANGIIQSVRGNGGGIRLAKPPSEIAIGDVVRITESDMFLVACFDAAAPACRISSDCKLRAALAQALGSFMSVLDGYTLADVIVNRQSRIQSLLGIEIVADRPAPAAGRAAAAGSAPRRLR